MSAIPNLTQFFGGGPVAPPDGISTDPKLDYTVPSPWENPDLWDTVIFTLSSDDSVTFELPPVGMGTCEIKVPWKVKLDAKGGAGKGKPRTSKTGGEATKDKCKIHACDEAWPYICAAALKIIPGSGPWKVSHPKFTFATMTEVMISGWTDAPKEDAHGMIDWEFEYQELKPSAQSGTGGGSAAQTPDAADKQRNTPGAGQQSQGSPKKNDPNANKALADSQGKAAQP